MGIKKNMQKSLNLILLFVILSCSLSLRKDKNSNNEIANLSSKSIAQPESEKFFSENFFPVEWYILHNFCDKQKDLVKVKFEIDEDNDNATYGLKSKIIGEKPSCFE